MHGDGCYKEADWLRGMVGDVILSYSCVVVHFGSLSSNFLGKNQAHRSQSKHIDAQAEYMVLIVI